MRLVVAMMKHETNTFSPLPTNAEAFGANGPLFGPAAYAAMQGTRTAIGAFLDLAKAEGAEITVPLAADALPGGKVTAAAFETFVTAIVDAVDERCDAVLLDLHGAMVCEHDDDGEGALLEAIRRRRPDIPIGVALDLHANITQRMIDNATAIVGYKTYPHIDMYEAGQAAGRIVLNALAGEVQPVMAWQRVPAIAATLCMGTTGPGPMTDLAAAARRAEVTREVLAASVFGGFPMADVPAPGLSVVAVADRDALRAQRVARRLAAEAWARRDAFIYRSEPLAQSVARAKSLADRKGPVLLIDHADNCASGGTQDTMHVVAEVLRQGLRDVAVAAIRDPGAVGRLAEIGVGGTATIDLGGKTALPALGLKGEPLRLTGRINFVGEGEFVITGPMLTGVSASMGRSVVFETEGVEIVVTEKPYEPWDLGVFRCVGIEPTAKRFLVLKSRMHYRAVFAPIAGSIVECDGVGVTSSNLELFRFDKLARPVFPFDRDLAWASGDA